MGHPCSRCAQSSLKYRRLLGSKKYSYCIRRGYSCDIYEVSEQEITKLSRENDRLDTEIRRSEEEEDATRACRKRFQRLRDILKQKESEIIRRNLNNIEDFKRIEEEERNATGLSEVPFDPIIALEQFSSEILKL